jgi:hypothetical protein
MRLTHNPEALPGCCFICGSASREFFIDTGRTIEFHGAVYFCNECLSEIAHAAGYASPDYRKNLEIKITHMEDVIFELKTKAQGMEAALNGLVGAGFQLPSYDPSIGSIDFPAPENNDSIQRREGSLGDGEGKTSEPNNDERMAELRPNGISDESPGSDYELEL